MTSHEQRGEVHCILQRAINAHILDRALRKTGNRGLQPALDYLQEHEGSDGADSDGEDGQDMNIASAGGSDAEAKVCLPVLQ